MKPKYFFAFSFIMLVFACNNNKIESTLSSDLLTSKVETKSTANFDFKNVIKDTLAWKNLSGDEKLKECQISDSALDNLSTVDLAKICFDYPLFFEFILTNNEEKAISDMIESFNGLKELSNRSDGAKELMKLYSDIVVLKGNKLSSLREPGTPLRFKYLELLLTNSKFLALLDDYGKQSLVDLLEKKQQEKLQNSRIYGTYSTGSIGRFLTKVSNIKKFEISSSISLNTSYVIYVTTPFGKSVEAYTKDEFTSAEKYDATQEILNNYNVVLLDSASLTYNCHGYAWNMTYGGDACVIFSTLTFQNDNLSNYWTNDLYTTTAPSNSYGCRRIFYYNGDHSAILPYASTEYQSKWGNGPLVRHAPTMVPYTYNASYRTSYYLPGISGQEYVSMDNTYEYIVLPYMNYATYVWSIEDNYNRYSIVSQSGNTANIFFHNGGTFQIYCDIYNSLDELVFTVFFEALNGDY